MFPIRDLNPTSRLTIVTWLIIVGAAAIYFFVQPSSGDESVTFLYEQATIPCEILAAEPLTVAEIQTGRCGVDTGPTFDPDKRVYVSLVVAIFLHGSLMHLLGNLWILWIFGNNVEDDLGSIWFAMFYLVAGLGASLGHVVLHADDTTPVVGASGAIAGVMGAYLILHPRAGVVSIILPLWFLPFTVPAALYLVVWFGLQFLLADQDTNIAWEAHVVGFAIGVVIALWLRSTGFVDRRRRAVDPVVRRAR